MTRFAASLQPSLVDKTVAHSARRWSTEEAAACFSILKNGPRLERSEVLPARREARRLEPGDGDDRPQRRHARPSCGRARARDRAGVIPSFADGLSPDPRRRGPACPRRGRGSGDAVAGQLARRRARAPHGPGVGGHLDHGVSGGPHRRAVAGRRSVLHRVRHRLSEGRYRPPQRRHRHPQRPADRSGARREEDRRSRSCGLFRTQARQRRRRRALRRRHRRRQPISGRRAG